MGLSRAATLAVFAAVCAVFVGPLAQAYIATVTPGGKPVRWSGGKAHVNLAGNPVNRNGLSDTEAFDAIVHGLERWETASGGTVGFDYWQGTDPKIYEANSAFNGQNSIYFASNGNGAMTLTPNVLGLTQVWYDTNSGQILETDIVLNDVNFEFTTNSRDTSGYGTGMHPLTVGGEKPSVFIENVITHELGHVFGLSHSGGLQSTMLFMESPEQAHLGCDEQIGIHALYPNADAAARGSLGGTVLTESGVPLLGAHVLAISRDRGVVLATGLTDKAGHYEISALEPGVYFLMVEPYFAGASPLPNYYASMNVDICSGHAFGRSFLTDGTENRLLPVNVSAGGSAAAPTMSAHCGSGAGASVESVGARSSPSHIATGSTHASAQNTALYVGGSAATGFGITDRFNPGGGASYSLPSLAGHVEIHAIGYSLYSPLKLSLRLLGPDGDEATARIFDPSFEGDSGYTNYDSYLVADGLPPGDYTLEVTSSSLDASMYPAGLVSLDSVPFLVITGKVGDLPSPLAASLPMNGRCEFAENFQPYTSPRGDPPRSSTSQDDGEKSVGFCGTLSSNKPNDSGGAGPPEGPSAGAVVGWLFPWILMGLLPGLLRRFGGAVQRREGRILGRFKV
jgi:hypothetical protein